VLCVLRDEFKLNITAVHINHNIRGEAAERDARFVEELCRKYGVKFKLFGFPVEDYARENSLTVEEAGRKLRYDAFYEVAGKDGKIAVAHNMNDNAETMLMRFFRGTGIKGLGGISPVRDNIIRPLLCVKRAEIEKYCSEKGIEYQTDATNFETDYTRNKIRLSLIPRIEEAFNGSLAETMFRTSTLIGDENDYIEKVANEAYRDCLCGENKISIERLLKYDRVIMRRIVRKGFVHYSADLHDIAFDHVEAVLSLTSKKSGSKIKLPNNLYAVREFDSIAFKQNEVLQSGFCREIKLDEEIYIEACGLSFLLTKQKTKDEIQQIELDLDAIDGKKLEIRSRQSGDKIYLKGMDGSKSIKKLFTEYKIPSDKRDAIPLLAIGNDVVWIYNMKTSGRYKADENTVNKGYLRIIERRKQND
jgi:tRNA(Ile)-lysidine synthase